MPDYRLYILDRDSGHIQTAETFSAADDGAAVHRVRLRGRTEPLELWCGARKLLRVDAQPDAAAFSDGRGD